MEGQMDRQTDRHGHNYIPSPLAGGGGGGVKH